jgi:hypothetical protein
MRNLNDAWFRILFTRNFTNRSVLEMDINKNNIQLDLEKDELLKLMTRIYHECGHSLDKDDPIIVQYLFHKIALAQFTENQGRIMTAFHDALLPRIERAEEQFERKKVEFVDHLEGVHRESLRAMNKQYLDMVNGTLDKVGKAVAAQMENIIKYMRSEQHDLSRMMEQEHVKFRNTAERFEAFLWKAAYFVGGGLALGGIAVAVALYFK